MIRSFKNGFTLAEVLITLGIIGVVAAMTMPTLMNSTNGAQYKTAYKKALSVLSQAVVLNVALDDYDLSQTNKGSEDDGEVTTASGDTTLYNLFNNRMNVVKTSDGGSDEAGWEASMTRGSGEDAKTTKAAFGGKASGNYTLYFNDGITFTFPKDAGACTEGNSTTDESLCYGVIDVNGEKNPNKLVVCDTGSDGDNCKVSNPTDIYPVVMYDQTILPATRAGEAVLYGAGK